MNRTEEFIYSGLSFDYKNWKDIEKKMSSQEGMLYILGDTKFRFEKKEYDVTYPSKEHVTLGGETPKYEELSITHDYKEGFTEVTHPARGSAETVISLVNADAIDTALILSDLQGEGLRPALLNMAAPTNPGGKYNIGEKAQEEMIFYRSNMWAYLDPKGTSGLGGGVGKFPHYPLPDIGGLHTPGVTFIRGSEADKFKLIKPRSVDIVSVAAIKSPKLVNGGYSPSDRERMFNKIRTILTIAYEHGNNAVVLSAFGCGMYKNPPGCVSKLFDEVIKAHFAGVFKRIVFAIKCVDGKLLNYETFAKVFPEDKELEKKIRLFPQRLLGRFGEPTAWGSTTGFGSSSTEFGPSGTGFGSSTTGFGSLITEFGSSNTGFGSSSIDFGSQNTGFGSSTTGFGSSTTGFGSLIAEFGSSNTGFGSSSIDFGSQNTGFGSSTTGFGSSSTNLGSQSIEPARLSFK